MAEITASMVGELRARTDAPMMECKKALTEAQGDLNKAEELLRVKLGSKASKASSRVTSEGIVSVFVGGNTGAMIELNCETDFVAKNEDFLKFGNALAEIVAKRNPIDVPALSALEFDGATVEARRTALIGKMGENASIRRFKRFSGDAKLMTYLHGNRIGVVVEYVGDDVAAKDVAMHVAAMKPLALSAAEVSAELIEKERSVAALKAAEDNAKAVAEGKKPQPAEIVARRVDGAVQKFLKEVSLYDQAFVKNDKQTVVQMLKATGTQLQGFTIFVVGEGIAKKTDDFAAEVAAQVAAAKAG